MKKYAPFFLSVIWVSLMASLLIFLGCSRSDDAEKRSTVPPQKETAGKVTGRDDRFIAYDNGTVLDTKTNLMWAAKDNGSYISGANAKAYCENYREGGYTDWRLPTLDELEGLYDKAKTYKSDDCGYDVHLTELIRLTCDRAWSSKTNRIDTFFFSFTDGGKGAFPESIKLSRALPVRVFGERETLTKKSGSSISASQGGNDKSVEKTLQQQKNAAETATPWTYSESKDQMSGKVSKHATTESVNTVNFEFPYHGEQRGTIMVYDNTVLFYVKKGQVICQGGSEYGTCGVRVKFDDAKDRYVDARISGDNSTTISITEPGFLKTIKKSKKLMIQVNMFQNGLPVFTFNVGGLIQR